MLCSSQVFKSLVEITKDIAGAKVENNKFCVSVHYRNVDEKVMCLVVYVLLPHASLTNDPCTSLFGSA